MRSRQRKKSKEIQSDNSNVYPVLSTSYAIEHMDIQEHTNGLEDKYRVVIDALFFQGMTQQEASDELNIPLGTVKSRLKIGLRELRKLFGVIFWIICIL